MSNPRLSVGDVVQVKWADAPDSITIVTDFDKYVSRKASGSYKGFDRDSALKRNRCVYGFEASQVAAKLGNIFDGKFNLALAEAALEAAQA